VKTKHSILAQTPHTNCQAWWWRGDDFWLVSHPQGLGTLQSLSRPWSMWPWTLYTKVF